MSTSQLSTTVVTVPKQNDFSTLEEGLRRFLPDYCAAKRQHATKYKESIDGYCITLEMLFDEKASDASRGTIANAIKKSRVTVDNNIEKARKEFDQLFLNKQMVDGIVVDPNLTKLVKDVRDKFIVPGTDSLLISNSGIGSHRMLELLALILGVRILETGTVNWIGSKTRGIDLNVGKVKRILKNEGIPISFDTFNVLLGKKFSDNELKQNLALFVKGNHEFEIIHQNNREFIAIKWEYLNDLTTEVLRILYDKDAWDPGSALKKDDIKTEWERRSKLAGRKAIQFTPHYKHWRFCPAGENSVFLRRDKKYHFIKGQKYVSTLLVAHPNWTFNDVYNQAQADGYTNIYTPRSLKTYYTNLVKDHTAEDALREAIRVLDGEMNKTLPFQVLCSRIQNVTIVDEVLRKWIMENDKAFEYFALPGEKKKYVKLINKRAKLVTPRSKKKSSQRQSQVSSQPQIKPLAIDWASIRAYILLQVPETQTFPVLSSSIDNILTIMKCGNKELEYNSVFDWLLTVVGFTTMDSKDKNALRKEVLGSVETYLSNFYKLKTGRDLKADIQYSNNNSTSLGLGAMMNYLSTLSYLPDKNTTYPSWSLEMTIKAAMRTAKKGRDYDMAHLGKTINLSDKDSSSQLHASLLLFSFLASEL